MYKEARTLRFEGTAFREARKAVSFRSEEKRVLGCLEEQVLDFIVS